MVSDPIWDTFHNADRIGTEASKIWTAIDATLADPKGMFGACTEIADGKDWGEGEWACVSAWAAYKVKSRGSRKRFALTFSTSFFSTRELDGTWPHAERAKLITAYSPDVRGHWKFGDEFGLNGNGAAEGCEQGKSSNLWIRKNGRTKDLRECAWFFVTALEVICSTQDLESEVLKPASLLITGDTEKIAFRGVRGVLR